jgi:hypothetical protein
MAKKQMLLTVINHSTKEFVNTIIDPTAAQLAEMKALYSGAEYEHEYISADGLLANEIWKECVEVAADTGEDPQAVYDQHIANLEAMAAQ